MPRPVGDLPHMVADLAGFVGKGRKESVMDASLVAKDEFLAGPPRVGISKSATFIPTASKPSGYARWNARFDLKGHANPTSLVRYTGPLHWIERGTRPHMIAPRRRGRRRSGARALLLPDGGIRSQPIRHPGTAARPFFGRVKARTVVRASKTLQAGLRRNIARAGFGAAARAVRR